MSLSSKQQNCIEPDIHSSSEEYAQRFAGLVGEWLLKIQEEKVLKLLQSYQVRTVLDVGGGHAQLAVPLVRAGYAVTVTGSSEVCAQRLRAELDANRLTFQKCSLFDLPFADCSFDVVLCFRQLCHVTQPEVLLKELTRVAKQVVLIDYPPARGFNALSSYLFPLKKLIEGNTRRFQVFGGNQIASWYRDYGWQVVQQEGQLCFPLALHRAMRRLSLSQGLESWAHSKGLLPYLGSPIIALAERVGGDGVASQCAEE